jgi:hypothetical protein
MRRSLGLGQRLQFIELAWNWLSRYAQYCLVRFKSSSASTDYLTWRHQFLQKRLCLGLLLALFWHSLVSANGLHSVLFEFDKLRVFALSAYGDASIANQWRSASIVYYVFANVLLLACLIGQKTTWGRRYPEVFFLLFTCSLSNLIHIIFTFFNLPETPNPLLFLIIAVIIPVHWRLHLVYQIISITYYAIVYPITGVATLKLLSNSLVLAQLVFYLYTYRNA